MKKINSTSVVLLLFSLLLFSNANSQPMFDLNVISPMSLGNNAPTVIGIGGGIGLYSTAINLSGNKGTSYNKYKTQNYYNDCYNTLDPCIVFVAKKIFNAFKGIFKTVYSIPESKF